jgi:hypothetical protein
MEPWRRIPMVPGDRNMALDRLRADAAALAASSVWWGDGAGPEGERLEGVDSMIASRVDWRHRDRCTDPTGPPQGPITSYHAS